VASARAIHGDPGRRLQAGAQHVAAFRQEPLVAGDQQAHYLALLDADAKRTNGRPAVLDFEPRFRNGPPPGALPQTRMPASWFRSWQDRPSLWRVVRACSLGHRRADRRPATDRRPIP
jgi:hypothetical protein